MSWLGIRAVARVMVALEVAVKEWLLSSLFLICSRLHSFFTSIFDHSATALLTHSLTPVQCSVLSVVWIGEGVMDLMHKFTHPSSSQRDEQVTDDDHDNKEVGAPLAHSLTHSPTHSPLSLPFTH